jgi:hypothetical protein
MIDIIAELYRLRSLHGGACYNELTDLGERLRAEQLAAGVPPTSPLTPPVNRDRPHAQQEGPVLTCTMGNWVDPPPETYAYQWKRDEVDVGANMTAEYTIVAADVGRSFTCVVTATHAGGSTPSTSNAVVVVGAKKK